MLNNNSSDNFFYKGHELFIATMRDQFNLVSTRARPVMTSFLSLSEQEILMKIKPKDIEVHFFGGFENAIRKVAFICEPGWDVQYDIVCLVSDYDSRFKKLLHRDILGSLMSLQIKRELLGDFAIHDDCLYIFCKKKIAPFLIDHCSMIGKCPISLKIEESIELDVTMKEPIQINCASLRADAIIAQLAHVSRTEAANKIKQGFIKVNDVELEENRQLCFNDVVSIRKVGKFQFIEVLNTTRKNRYVLKFEKFI